MKHYRSWVFIGVILLNAAIGLLTFNSVRAAGVISLTTIGSAYSENFDTLASTGTSSSVPNGWDFIESLSGADATYAAGTGSSTAGNTYSFGAIGSNERAFGALQSASLRTIIGAQLSNNTGQMVNALTISYIGELWRLGASTGRTDRLDFQYSLNATSLTTGSWFDFDTLDFSTPNTAAPTGAKDGNLAANRTLISGSLFGLNIPNGSTFWIRWSDVDISGSEDGLAIDNFSLTPLSAPMVGSILRAGPNPTNAPSVDFTVTFNKPVSGVDTSDFDLTTSGLSGASVSALAGAGASYTVTVLTGSGSGTLRLDLTDNDSIVDSALIPLGGPGAGNGNFSGGETYTLERTAPQVSSITRLSANPTSSATVVFSLTFTEPVSGVDSSDFIIFAPDLTGASVNSISGSGGTYTITVNTGAGSGGLRLDVLDDDSITDTVGNPLGGPGLANGDYSGGETYTLDRSSQPGDGGLIVNEISNGLAGNEEWVELVVTGDQPLDLSGWIIDDNNGEFGSLASGNGIATGHLRFSPSLPACPSGRSLTAAPPGSRIVIYNSDDVAGSLAAYPNDPCDTNDDGLYYLPVGLVHNTAVLEHCSANPGLPDQPGYTGCAYTSPANSWSAVLLANTGDAMQARKPNSVFFHGFAYGNVAIPSAPLFPDGQPSFNVNGSTGTNIAYQFNCGNYFSNASSQFTRLNASLSSPGSANNLNNAVFIRSLENRTFNLSNLGDVENCRIEPQVATGFLQTQVATGQDAQLTVSLSNAYQNLDGFALDLVGLQFTDALPAGLLLSGANPVSNSCGGIFSGVDGGNSFSLSGVALPGRVGADPSVCTLVVNVAAAVSGVYTNEILAGAVTSASLDASGGANADPASASLIVVDAVSPTSLPDTGFAPGRITRLPHQPLSQAYDTSQDMLVEIPKLGVLAPIVGVPITAGGWDVTWLGQSAGWLNGTAFPTWAGNSVITAHVWDALNQPGTFARLNELQWGDAILIHFAGEKYLYEVRSSSVVADDDMALISQHEDHAWLTLLTCQNFDPQADSYPNRLIVRAVLVSQH